MIPIRTSIELHDIPGVVIALIITNVAIFLYQIGLPADEASRFIQTYALTPSDYGGFANAGADGITSHDLLALISNMFLHGGWLHLIANMWTLWLFGSVMEQHLGPGRFVLLYLVSGLVANFAHIGSEIWSTIPVLGASGAIAGIMGAFTLQHPKAKILILTMIWFFPITYSLSAIYFTGIWFAFQIFGGLIELASTGQGGGVAWWAHIGGLAAGLGLIKFIGTPKPTRRIGAARARQSGFDDSKFRVVRVIGEQRPRRFKIGAGRNDHEKDRPTREEPAEKSRSQNQETNANAGNSTLRSLAKVQGAAILDNLKLSFKDKRAKPTPPPEATDPRPTPQPKPRTRRKKSIIPQTVKSPWADEN